MKIIRRNQVEEKTGLCGRTIDRKEKAGQFPHRIKLGANSVGWIDSEIDEWIKGLERVNAGQGAAKQVAAS